MSQLNTQIAWSDDPNNPNSLASAARMNAIIGSAALLNQAITAQADKAVTVEADRVLLGDSAATSPTAYPASVTLANLLPETVRNGSKLYAVATHTVVSSVDVYAVPLPYVTAYTAGQLVNFRTNYANTLPSAINVNGIGQKALKSISGADLVAGNILAGQIVECIYDSITDTFVATNLVGGGAIGASQISEGVRMSANQYGTASGTATAWNVNIAPQLTSLTDGMVIRFKAPATSGAGVSVTVNTTSPTTLVLLKSGSASIGAGEITSGMAVEMVKIGANFYLTSPTVTSLPFAFGTVTLGTQAAPTVCGTASCPAFATGTGIVVTVCYASSSPGGSAIGVTVDPVSSGNWPLKFYVANGLGSAKAANWIAFPTG